MHTLSPNYPSLRSEHGGLALISSLYIYLTYRDLHITCKCTSKRVDVPRLYLHIYACTRIKKKKTKQKIVRLACQQQNWYEILVDTLDVHTKQSLVILLADIITYIFICIKSWYSRKSDDFISINAYMWYIFLLYHLAWNL